MLQNCHRLFFKIYSTVITKKFYFAILVAAVLLPFSAVSKPYKDIALYVNSADGQFSKGEEIVFSGVALKDIDVPLVMKVYENGIETETHPVTLSRDSSVIWRCSYDKCKSVYIEISPTGSKLTNAVGAIVAPEDFRPVYDEPEDFARYWKKQVAAMRAVKPEVKRTPVSLDADDAERFDAWALEVSMHQGPSVHGYLVIPKNATAKSLPIVIFAHSAGVADVSKRSSLPQALEFARMGDGAIALDMNAHGMPDNRPQEYYDELEKGALKGYINRPLTTREDYYFRLMFLRMERALDYLCTLPEWDRRRVAVRGGSQGGSQAIALAGLDRRVSMVVAHVPGNIDMGSSLQGRRSVTPNYSSTIKRNPELAESILPYFDCANFLRHTRAALRFEAGLVDKTCPPECVFAGYNVCRSKDKAIVTFPYRPHTAGSMAPMYLKIHEATIEVPRIKALDDYLKAGRP